MITGHEGSNPADIRFHDVKHPGEARHAMPDDHVGKSKTAAKDSNRDNIFPRPRHRIWKLA
jgi:hypothetical protein